MPLLRRRGSTFKSPFLILLFISVYFLFASAQNTEISTTSEPAVTSTETETTSISSSLASETLQTSESTEVSSTSAVTPTETLDTSIPDAPASEAVTLPPTETLTTEAVTPSDAPQAPATSAQTQDSNVPPQERTADLELPDLTLTETLPEPSIKVENPATTNPSTFSATDSGSPRTGRRIPFISKFVPPKPEARRQTVSQVPPASSSVPPQRPIPFVPPPRPQPQETTQEEEPEENSVATSQSRRRPKTIESRDVPAFPSSTSMNDPPPILTSQKPSPVSPLPSIKPRPEDTPDSFSPIITPPPTISSTPPKFTAPSEMETENSKHDANSVSSSDSPQPTAKEENVSLRIAQSEEGPIRMEKPTTSSSKTTTIIAAAAASSVFLLSGVSGILFFYRRKRARPSSTATFASTISIMDERGLSLEEEQIYTVHIPYVPELEDELKLSVGDQVIIQERFQDKWVLGTNLTTGDSGCFPILCLDEDAASSIPSEFGSMYSMDRNTMSDIHSQRSYSLNLRNSSSTGYTTSVMERDTHLM